MINTSIHDQINVPIETLFNSFRLPVANQIERQVSYVIYAQINRSVWFATLDRVWTQVGLKILIFAVNGKIVIT